MSSEPATAPTMTVFVSTWRSTVNVGVSGLLSGRGHRGLHGDDHRHGFELRIGDGANRFRDGLRRRDR